MIALLIIFASIVVVGIILYIHDRLTYKPQPAEESDTQQQPTSEVCCGLHIACEKDSLSTAASDRIIYYDDEELDSYRGTSPDSYSPEAVEQFRDILLTLIPSDIAGWARSLQLRGIELPSSVRDELLMIVAEARANPI